MVKKRTLVLAVVISIVCTFLTTSVANEHFLGKGNITANSKIFMSDSVNFANNDANAKGTDVNYEAVESIKEFIEKNYYKDTKNVDFNDGVIKGLFESLGDPYSSYMNAEEFKEFKELSLKNEYSGVGIMFEPGKDGFIHVVSTFEGTPAHRAGIKSGDIIYKVDDKAVKASEYNTISSRIKGKVGTTVKITIIKSGTKSTKDYVLTREVIHIKSVTSKKMKNEVGYIKITSFDENVSTLFNENVKKLGDIKSLIIDLRGNPGGLIDTCVEVADRILGNALVVYTTDRDGVKREYKSDALESLDIPIVVLTDGGSASASEILAGALKDNKKAKLIGEKTFGKGVVQSVIPLVDGSAIKLTTSQYFTPSGVVIDKKGIQPDIKIKDNLKTKNDEVIDRALKYLKTVK